jgi:hypothetical protein
MAAALARSSEARNYRASGAHSRVALNRADPAQNGPGVGGPPVLTDSRQIDHNHRRSCSRGIRTWAFAEGELQLPTM